MAEGDRRRTPAPQPSLAARLLGCDLRSLAAFRIGMALVVLIDLSVRATDLRAMYTDHGVLPRSELLQMFDFLHRWPLCVHLIGGSTWSQAALFLLTAAFALALLVGYHTRAATVAVWLMVSSLQLRNLFIGHGSDAQLRMMLFWGIFLPLGARCSVDSARRWVPQRDERQQLLSVGTVALIAQIVIIYLSTGYAKSLYPQWRNGTAVGYVFDNEIWGTYIGHFLQHFPHLCAFLDYATLFLELAGPVLLFVPLFFGPLRTAVVAALIAMHAGFAIGMRVGIFPFTSIAALLCLLPGWFWEQALPRAPWGQATFPARVASSRLFLLGKSSLSPSSPSPRPFPARSRVGEAVCAVFLVFLVMWNIGVVRDNTYTAPPQIAWLGDAVFLQQDWRMYSRVSTRTGWIVIPGTLRDGTQIDLFRLGGPAPDLSLYRDGEGVSFERPASVLYRVKNYRWLGMMDRLIHYKRGDRQALLYGRYLCREWNARQHGDKQLESFQIVAMARDDHPEPRTYGTADYQREVVWSHWCFR